MYRGTSQGRISEDITETSDISDANESDADESDADESDADESDSDKSDGQKSDDEKSNTEKHYAEKIYPEKIYPEKSYSEKSYPEKSYAQKSFVETEAEKVKEQELKEKAHPASPPNSSSHGSTAADAAFIGTQNGSFHLNSHSCCLWDPQSLFCGPGWFQNSILLPYAANSGRVGKV